jgi:hypothetical protein
MKTENELHKHAVGLLLESTDITRKIRELKERQVKIQLEATDIDRKLACIKTERSSRPALPFRRMIEQQN